MTKTQCLRTTWDGTTQRTITTFLNPCQVSDTNLYRHTLFMAIILVCCLTHYQVELGICLEGIMKSYKKGKISDGLQNTPFCQRVLHDLLLTNNSSFLEDLHGKELTLLWACHLPDKKNFAIS